MRTQEILPSKTRTPIQYTQVTDSTQGQSSIDSYILFLIFIIGILGASYILSLSSSNSSPFTSQGYVLESVEG